MEKLKIAAEFDQTANLILYEGDCLELLPMIPDRFVKLVVTSPPYNLGKPYESRLDLDDYLAWQRKVIEECARVLDERGSICWQVGNYVENGEIIPLDIVLYPIFCFTGSTFAKPDHLAFWARASCLQALLRSLRGHPLVYKK